MWLDWAERLQIRLKECPTILIADELRECAIRFYRDGRAWRETGVALTTTAAAQADYAVTVPANTALAGLPAVWIGATEAAEATPGRQEDYEPAEAGTTKTVAVISASTIRLLPTPTAGGEAVTGTVAYCPSDDSTGILESLYFNHRDTIEDMTLTRMMTQAEKPWTNLPLAGKHDSDAVASALYDGTMSGPVRRTRLRTKLSVI